VLLKRDEGAAAVEFALVLPILILILFGIIEFGFAFYNKEVITNASREGARAGIVQAPKLTETAIKDVAKDYLAAAGWDKTKADISVTGAGGSFPNPLTVTVNYPYSFSVLPKFIPGFGLKGTLNCPSDFLCATTVMKHE
jgi:Flp pilus assembly protein TadG